MGEREQSTGEVIHFFCEHCQISLTVDDSLAGVTGPCPSCGQVITAPRSSSELRGLSEPREVAIRPRRPKAARGSSSSSEGVEVKVPSHEVPVGDARPDRRRRSVSPETGVSAAHRERAEAAAVAKMLVAGLIVLAIVLAVAYWLNLRFNAS